MFKDGEKFSFKELQEKVYNDYYSIGDKFEVVDNKENEDIKVGEIIEISYIDYEVDYHFPEHIFFLFPNAEYGIELDDDILLKLVQ